ncbi:MAG: ASKHA domain-containing protein [Actinobacteria bacterium]|nr:ASKHA domain-containing protein [Actinomycetota bacterium]
MTPPRSGRKQRQGATGTTLFDRADTIQMKVPTSCGRNGECHECIVEILSGEESLAPPTEAEQFLRGKYRLACQARVVDPHVEPVFAPLKRRRQILSRGQRRAIALDPHVRRAGDGVYTGDARIDTYRGAVYGLAIDAGTTTIALSLLDLQSGTVLFTGALENPQRFGGSDVMHRISYDGGPFRGELHRAIINAVNAEIREMCRQLRFSRRLIYEVVVVGNATMRDLFFGLDIQSIGTRPYKSLTELALLRGERATTALSVPARALGLLINPQGTIYGGPLIASHVGADAAADLLALGLDERDDAGEVVMLVDVGTNTEVIVGNARRMVATSCPAGPAFEGGHVTYGLPGCQGAIESVSLDNGRITYSVIGGGEPEGICGSGLIDLLAELLRHHRINSLGTFADGAATVPIVPERGITFSRADLSELAQAKAANACGQLLALRAFGIHPERLKHVYLAGGFANYINVVNAIAIGFIPVLPLERIVKVGNAALEGATLMLLSQQKRRRIEELVRRIEHIELETSPDFFDLFVDGCLFQPMVPTSDLVPATHPTV